MTIGDFLKRAEAELKAAGIGSARLDVLILLEDELLKDRAWVLAHPEQKINTVQVRRLDKKVKRRTDHVPLAYIRGFSEFYARKFKVNRYVLEPRPESETMIELLKKIVESGEWRVESDPKNSSLFPLPSTLSIADVGTGSGALGITAALEIHGSTVDLYDISASALAVAKHNSHLHELNLHARKMDLLARPLRPYDVILANLPYLPDNWTLHPSIKMEPRIAFLGGKDGLEVYRRLFNQLQRFSWRPRHVLTESLPPQHKKLSAIAADHGFKLHHSQDFIQIFNPRD